MLIYEFYSFISLLKRMLLILSVLQERLHLNTLPQLAVLLSHSLSNLSLQLWKRAHCRNKGHWGPLPLRQRSFGLRLAVCRKNNNLEYQWPLCVSHGAQIVAGLGISAPYCFPHLDSHNSSDLFSLTNNYIKDIYELYMSNPFSLLWLEKPNIVISLILCICQ